ncbi:MAG: DedA family protein [Chloroflexota bacterium]
MPAWAQEAIGSFGYVAIFLLVAVEGLGIPLPGETALLVAAAMSGASFGGQLDIRLVIAVAAIGAIIGDSGGYFLGRRWGRQLLERWGPRFGLSSKRLARVERFFARYGVLTVFLGRYQALFRTYVGIIAGVAHMPFRIFFPVRLASCVVWALVYGIPAYFLGNQWSRVAALFHTFGLFSLGLGAALVVVAAAVVLLRRPHLRESPQ